MTRNRERIEAARRTPDELRQIAEAVLRKWVDFAIRTVDDETSEGKGALVRDAGVHDAALIAELMRTATVTVTWPVDEVPPELTEGDHR